MGNNKENREQDITCFDEFEIELHYVEALIDLLYQLPSGHKHQAQTLEDLHTHKHAMRSHYNKIRNTIMKCICE